MILTSLLLLGVSIIILVLTLLLHGQMGTKIPTQVFNLLKKKAAQAPCAFKVAAVGINTHGEAVIRTCNEYRFDRGGGGLHAEEKIFRVAKRKNISIIFICRVSKAGKVLPISPCKRCQKKADELGIKIISVEE